MHVTTDHVEQISRRYEPVALTRRQRRDRRRYAHQLLAAARGWRHTAARCCHLAGRAGEVLALLAVVAVPVLAVVQMPTLGAAVTSMVWPVLAALVAFAVCCMLEESAARWRRLRTVTITAIEAQLDDGVIVDVLRRHPRDPQTASAVVDELAALQAS